MLPMSSTTATRSWRRIGLRYGLGGGAAFAAAGVVVGGIGGLVTSLPIVIAGATGGWLTGPRAALAERRSDWLAIVLALALWAVICGAIVTGIQFGVATAVGSAQSPLEFAAVAIGLGVWLGLIGTVVAGLFALPFTLVAAAIWAALIRRERDRWQA